MWAHRDDDPKSCTAFPGTWSGTASVTPVGKSFYTPSGVNGYIMNFDVKARASSDALGSSTMSPMLSSQPRNSTLTARSNSGTCLDRRDQIAIY